MNQIITVTGLANPDFLQEYAQPGRVGLSGGVTLHVTYVLKRGAGRSKLEQLRVRMRRRVRARIKYLKASG